MRISDWSSDVCSSDLLLEVHDGAALDAAACLLADTHDAGPRRAVGARDAAADFAAADIQSGGEAAFHQTFPHVAMMSPAWLCGAARRITCSPLCFPLRPAVRKSVVWGQRVVKRFDLVGR